MSGFLHCILRAAALPLLVVFALTGCADELTDINVDPNAFTEVSPEDLLSGSMKNGLDLIGGEMNNELFLTYGQYAGGIGGQFPRYFFTDAGVNEFWNDLYIDVLKSAQVIIDDYANDPAFANRVRIARIWRAYVYSVAVATWGPVPYASALGDELDIRYDTEEAIYTDLLAELRAAAGGLDPAADRLARDPLFGGRTDHWIAFGNSLRLKLALRVTEAFPALAEEHGREVMAPGVALITENAGNAILRWGTTEENWSHYYRRYVFGNNNAQEPRVSDWYYLHVKGYDDPRITAIMEPSEVPLTVLDTLFSVAGDSNVVVEYNIPYLGRPAGNDNTIPEWDVLPPENPLQGVFEENYSLAKLDVYFAPDAFYPLLTAGETRFLQAEAAVRGWGGERSAREYYETGIRLSFERYGVSGADAYLAQDGIAWGAAAAGLRHFTGIVTTGITADPLDQIVTQRWLATFWQGHDAWCLIRRTRLLDVPPHMEPDGPAQAIGFANVPERMIYAPEEMAINRSGYETGLAALGGPDALTTPLAIGRPDDYPDWRELRPDLNFDYAHGYYGDTLEELIAAGIPFTIQ